VTSAAGILISREAPSLATPAARASGGFIATQAYDVFLFILPPLLALAVAELLSIFDAPFEVTDFLGAKARRISIFVSVWTYAHLVAVLFRSHANPEVFARHRTRFTWVPLLLLVALVGSDWILASAIVVAALWDVYHSSMQTFGFCRIYDARAGNPPELGRRLDLWLNHWIYIGPILGGLSLIPTLQVVASYQAVGWDAPLRWLDAIAGIHREIRIGLITAGTLFLAYYVQAYARLSRQGYRISRQKIALLLSTAVTSIYAWGFVPPLEAFFVANLFHGLQYFAIVWWTEKRSIRRLFRLSNLDGGQWLALLLFASIVGLFGLGYELQNYRDLRWAMAAGLVIALMHFWYDGFVWSVRRREV
jgi:hypothetical protein